MRIDAHVHFWNYDAREYAWLDDSMAKLRRDFSPKDLEPLLKANGFDGCIAVQTRQTLEENRFLLDLAHRHAFIKGVVGWVDLRAKDVERELEKLAADPLFVGVRHIAQGEPDDRFLARDEFVAGVAKLARFDLAYDILVYPRQLPAAIELVRRVPSLRFVLDHCAKPDIRNGAWEPWATHIRELAQLPNVAVKLSGLVTEANWKTWTAEQLKPYVDHVVACFGPTRCMIGSDWPVCLVAGGFGQVIEIGMRAAQSAAAPADCKVSYRLIARSGGG